MFKTVFVIFGGLKPLYIKGFKPQKTVKTIKTIKTYYVKHTKQELCVK
jgi:hypothetical protein